jgi:hypothetical protein
MVKDRGLRKAGPLEARRKQEQSIYKMHRVIRIPKWTRRLSISAFAFMQTHAAVFANGVVTYFCLQFIAYKKAGN